MRKKVNIHVSEIRRIRRERGMTQAELARATGMPQPAISRMESGWAVPTIDTLEKLLRAFGCRLIVAPL